MPENELNHIAFILDGNRRWAKNQGKLTAQGHREGAETVKRTALRCQELGIPYATFWALSTENLKERSSAELEVMFEMITKIPEYFAELMDKGIRMRTIGDISALPGKCRTTLREMEEKTRDFPSLVVTLAINYGGRDEILRATRKLMEQGASANEVTESTFAQALDTHPFPDPDLIIRTGGKKRLSGYLPWQSVYSELYFTETLWPDFDAAELDQAIAYFQSVQRNFGH